MYDRVLVITIKPYYSKVPSTGSAVLLSSTVPTTDIHGLLSIHQKQL